MRKYIDLLSTMTVPIKETPSLLRLFEGRSYDDMMARLYRYMKTINDDKAETTYRTEFTQQLNWAKTYLKTPDRISWYMRKIRAAIVVEYFDKTKNQDHILGGLSELVNIVDVWVRDSSEENIYYKQGFGSVVKGLRDNLMHHLGMAAPDIQTVPFGRTTSQDLWLKLDNIADHFNKTVSEYVPLDPRDHIVLQMGEFSWVKLSSHTCDKEAEAMGHCGNSGGSSDERILSLRKLMTVGGTQMWRPSLTFIIDGNGFLGEMKGRGNEKPAKKYHHYIAALLKNPIVKGVKGGGYLPKNNFSMDDLSQSERQELYLVKPTLMPLLEYWNKYGFDDHVRQMTISSIEPLDLGYLGFSEDGSRLIIRKAPWMEILADCGDKTVNAIIDSMGDVVEIDFDEGISRILDDLPEAMIKKILAYLRSEMSDEVADWEELHDSDLDSDSDIRDFLEDNQNDLYYALLGAERYGLVAGAEKDMNKYLLDLLDDFDNLECAPSDDADVYELYIPTDRLIHIIGEDELETIEDDWGESELTGDVQDWSGYDAEYAIEQYQNECPDECRVSIPDMKPIAEMTDYEIQTEYEQIMTLRDDNHYEINMERFQSDMNYDGRGGHRPRIEERLKTARKRYWGV